MKAIKNLKKAIKHLSEALGGPYDVLWELFEPLLNLSKEFYHYPPPNSNFSKPVPLIITQILPSYRPPDTGLVGDDGRLPRKVIEEAIKAH